MLKRRTLLALMMPLALGATGCGYNQIQQLDEQAQSAMQTIQRARLNGAIQSGDPAQMAAADAQASAGIGRLLAIAEAYPQLKSNENFMQLQDEITGTENRIATARTDYNQAVQQYNSYIRTFPQAITAKVTGAKARTYYEAPAESQTAPTVKF
jgi:LemA protein